MTLAKSAERTTKKNYHTVGTHDMRVRYCYARISTQTPVRTLPDLINGEVNETVWLAEEYRRFTSVDERQLFIGSFDVATYSPKQLTKRSMCYGQSNECCDIEQITGDTVATQTVRVATKAVAMSKVVNK